MSKIRKHVQVNEKPMTKV